MPETPGTNADGTPKLGSWDATPEMVFDHRFSSMQTNTNKVNATLWGTQGGNYLYTSAKGINPNSSDKNNAVYFLVDPNTGQMVKSGNFYGTGGGIADVFGADDTLRAFSGRPTYGASLYGSSVTRDPNMASKVAVQQTTSGGTIGPNTTYTSSGAINNGSTPAVQAPAPQVQGVTQPSQGYQSPTAPLGSAERTQQLLDAAKKQTSTTGQNGTLQPQQAQNALVMPASGSVVDLLNLAGQDSSYAARQQLAKQYGIQGYTGTASQNQELSKKYLEAFNAQKGAAIPQNQAEARGAIQQYMEGTDQTVGTPSQRFYDAYSSMDPVVANIYDNVSRIVSRINNRTSMVEEYKNIIASSGIQAMQTELMDLNRIMDGTEDDIRDEITASGAFATESQVRALAGARNKTLLKQANALTDQLAIKQEYVDKIVSLTEADRKQVDDDMDRLLGLSTTLYDLQKSMNNAAKENYQSIVNQMGYEGLASALQGNPAGMRDAEKSLGLPSGSLSNPNFLAFEAAQNREKAQIIGSADSGYYAVTYDSQGNPSLKPLLGGTGGSGGSGGYKFTATQLNKGANNSGLSLDKFKGLDPEVQNFYVNMSPTNADNFKSSLAQVVSGEQNPDEMKEYIQGFGLQEPVQQYLNSEIDKRTPAKQPSTWDKVKSWVGF